MQCLDVGPILVEAFCVQLASAGRFAVIECVKYVVR